MRSELQRHHDLLGREQLRGGGHGNEPPPRICKGEEHEIPGPGFCFFFLLWMKRFQGIAMHTLSRRHSTAQKRQLLGLHRPPFRVARWTHLASNLSQPMTTCRRPRFRRQTSDGMLSSAAIRACLAEQSAVALGALSFGGKGKQDGHKLWALGTMSARNLRPYRFSLIRASLLLSLQ